MSKQEYADILAYLRLAFKRKRMLYTSDIMMALAIPYDNVRRVMYRLAKEGVVSFGDGLHQRGKKPRKADIRE